LVNNIRLIYVEHVRRKRSRTKQHYDTWLLGGLCYINKIDEIIVLASDLNIPPLCDKIKMLIVDSTNFLPRFLGLILRSKKNNSIIHIHYELSRYDIDALLQLIISMFIIKYVLRCRIVFSFYNPFFDPLKYKEYLALLLDEEEEYKIRIARIMLVLFYRLISRLSDIVVVHAKCFREFLRLLGIRNIIVLPHGYVKPECRKDDGKYIIVYGVISRRKRLEYILENYLRSPIDIPLLIVGGPSKADYKYFLNLYRLYQGRKGVRFLGFVPDEILDTLLYKAKVIILSQPLAVTPSGTLTQITKYCKPVLVPESNVYFKEYVPEESLVDFEHESLSDVIRNYNRLQKIVRKIVNRAKLECFNNIARLYAKLYEHLLRVKNTNR